MATQVIAKQVGYRARTEAHPIATRIVQATREEVASFLQTLGGFWRCFDAGITLQRMMNSRNGRQLSPKDRAEFQAILLERLADS